MANGFRVIVFTRDRHPSNHGSFTSHGGAWPVHCVEGTPGFQFHPELLPPPQALIVDKGMNASQDGFDPFESLTLLPGLRGAGVTRLFVVGLATEYCVRATTLSAMKAGFETWLIVDAVAPIERHPGDNDRAMLEMREKGACFATAGQVITLLDFQPHPSALIAVDLQNDFFPGGALPVPQALGSLLRFDFFSNTRQGVARRPCAARQGHERVGQSRSPD